jgi:hypothetical protein
MIRLRVGGIAETRALARRLHRAARGTGLRRELTREIRAEAKPVVQAVKAAARGLPDGPPPASTGLHRATANATVQRAPLGSGIGARIIVDPGRMPSGQGNLPFLMNKGQWRHPVFGGSAWVTQTSRARWFDDETTGREPQFRAACERAMDKIAEQIDG